jgi:RNA polymerase sigma-70 factor, ECF subfamily
MSSTAMTDPELLAAARKDPQVFKEFYERYALMIGFWLRRRTGGDDVAAELTAETFAQAWFSLRRFKGIEPDSGAPWLFGIARNLLGTYFRKQRVETAGRRKLGMAMMQRTDDEFERVEERMTAEASAPQVGDAFANLPADQRAALELRAIDQLPYAVVAERLGCTENAARLRVSRALGTLREGLRGEEARAGEEA